MKDFKKRDILYPILIAIIFIILVLILSKTTYLYGSQLDWYSQHISIPEYFRTLFYTLVQVFC